MNHYKSILVNKGLIEFELMSYKIQVTVDKQLNKMIKTGAKQMGLSVSSYARLALLSGLLRKNNKLLDRAIKDIKSNDIETLTLAEFNQQLNKR